jgi:predicted Zn finger-like uncharacterized protein
MVTVECPACEAPIRVDAEDAHRDELYGRRIACAACKQRWTFGHDAEGDLVLMGLVKASPEAP